MLARTYSAQLQGLEANTITVEVDLSRGKPQLIIIGLAAKEISESKERITAALLNCGIVPRAKKTIVNLAPASLRKSGSKFDLAILTAILQSYQVLPQQTKKTAFFGELALDGTVRKISGILPLIIASKKEGFSQIVIPKANEVEAGLLSDINIFTIEHVSQLISKKKVENLSKASIKNKQTRSKPQSLFLAIKGHAQAKRALEIAAAGGHSLHLVGPPGSGKSMLATALSELLPPLSKQQALEVNSIHSVAGTISNQLIILPPTRIVGPTITKTGLIGGGAKLNPGELSMAHHGVLFLDEINEFKRDTLESLRIPLETRQVQIQRSSGRATYPATALFICASNPCPCGYKYSTQKACKCSKNILDKYQKKLSGPLKDRIDMEVFVNSVTAAKITQSNQENELEITSRIKRARKIQKERFSQTQAALNAHLRSSEIQNHCKLELNALTLLNQASKKFRLSTRRYFKTICIAQTIADLENAQVIQIPHVAEALQFSKSKTELDT